MDADLETLFPGAREIEIAGEKLAISALRMDQIAPMLRAMAPVWPLLDERSLAQLDVGALMAGGTPDLVDAIVRATAIAAGRPAEWVGALYPDEFLRLAQAVAEVNADFFSRRLGPQLAATRAAIERLAGSRPSSDSSSAATTSTT